MRTPILAAIFFVLFWLGGPAAADSWRDYRSDEMGFVVQLPDDPTITQQPIDTTPVGTETQFLIDQGNTVYLILVSEYPAASLPSAPNADYFTTLLDAFVHAAGGTARSQTGMSIGPYQGSEAIVDHGVDVYVVRFFVVGNRLYQVLLGVPEGQESGAEAKRYFDSFRLID